MAGVELKAVMELMRHKTVEMTLRYAHLSPGHKKNAVDVLAKRIVTIWSQEPKVQEKQSEPVLLTR